MKRMLSGALLIALLVSATPAMAANDGTGFWERVSSSLVASLYSLFGVESEAEVEAVEPTQFLNASVAEEKSAGRAFGPFDDVVVAPDGQGVFEGELVVVVGEDFEAGTAEHFYYLHDKVTDIVVEMKPDGELPPGLEAGAMLRAVGRAQGGKIDIDLNANEGAEGSVTVLSEPAEVTSSGAATTRSVLGILVNANDANVGCSASQMMNILFNQDGNNVSDAFTSASHGELALSGDVVGPFSVDYASTTSYGTLGSAGRAAAEAAGIDTSTYDHIIHLLPNNPTQRYIGWGQYNGRYSWMLKCGSRDGIQHELGHNLNLGHANRDGREYNDRGSFMGYGGVGLRHAHAGHMDYLNWLPEAAIMYNPAPGTYTISSSDMYPGDVSYPQAIVLDKPDTNQQYYISYRTPTGYADKMPAGYDYTTQIHTYGPSSRSGTDFKFLSLGTPFVDSANGLTITQIGSSTDTGVTIEISTNCTTNAPSVNITPAEVGAVPGGTANFNVSVTNNNSTYCGDSAITLSVADTSTLLDTSLSTSRLTLGAGETGTLAIDATSDASIGGGSQTISVTADASGSTGSDTALYTIDATAPSAPTNVSASAHRKQVNITWTAATDNIAVAGYRVYREGAEIGTTQTTSFADKFPVSGVNTYQVVAFDAAGNESSLSASASAEFKSGGGGKGGKKGGGGSDGGDTSDTGGKPDKCSPWPSCNKN